MSTLSEAPAGEISENGDSSPKPGSKRWVKIIKKTARILLRTTITVVVLLIAVVLLIRVPAVQTWLAQRAASYLSDELHTNIRIGKVDIEFFNKVLLEDVYVEDQHKDTLLLAKTMKVDIGAFIWSQRYVNVSEISLLNTSIKVKKYGGERGLNYRFILMYFKDTDTTKHEPSKHPWKVDVGKVTLTNIRFAFIDTRDTIDDPGMDYENIVIPNLNASIDHIEPMGDSTRFKLEYLSAHERSGFTIRNMSSQMTVSETHAQFDNLLIETPGSQVNGYLGFSFKSIDDIDEDFVHRVVMNGHLTNTTLDMSDLVPFSKDLEGIKQTIKLSGSVSGTVSRLRCKGVSLYYGRKSHIFGDFNFTGLPDINQTDLDFRVRDFLSDKSDIEQLPLYPFSSHQKIPVLSNIAYLGDIRFNGKLDGFLNEFVTRGDLNTSIGKIRFENVAMWVGAGDSLLHYKGDVATENFNAGRFFEIPGMGEITSNTHIEGSGISSKYANAVMTGKIQSLAYSDYAYRNIDVNGQLARNLFTGKFNVVDNNIDLDFAGKIDFGGKLPDMEFQAELGKAKLGRLNLLQTNDSVNLIASNVNVHLHGDNIDNLRGEVSADQVDYHRNKEEYQLGLPYFKFYDDGLRHIHLESDFANLDIDGHYKIMELPDVMQNYLSTYVPASIPAVKVKAVKKKKKNEPEDYQSITFSLKTNRNVDFIKTFLPQLGLSPDIRFDGSFRSDTKEMHATLLTNTSISYDSIVYHQPSLQVSSNASKFDYTIRIGKIEMRDSVGISNISLQGNAASDTLGYKLTWNNETKRRNDGAFGGRFIFRSPQSLGMLIREGQMTVEDTTWTVQTGNDFRLDSTRLGIQGLNLVSNKQKIEIFGVASKDTSDEMLIRLHDFNLVNVNPFIGNDLTLSGFINGETALKDVYHSLIFNSNTDFTKLTVNKQPLGDGEVKAKWEPDSRAVRVDGNFQRGNVKNLHFYGVYLPEEKENSLDITLLLAAMDLRMFEPYLKDYCSAFTGTYRGALNVTGTPSKPQLEGYAYVTSKRIRIDYLNAELGFTDQRIDFKKNEITFENFEINDKFDDVLVNGKKKMFARVTNGHIYHQNLTNFQLDIDIQLEKFHILNTTAKDNPDFYGSLYVSGFVNIYGYLNNITIDAYEARTESVSRDLLTTELSRFYIPMSNPSEVGQYDFITFEKKKTAGSTASVTKPKSSSNLTLRLNIEATPDAEVFVIFDEKVGDVISARGYGNLMMEVKPNGDFTINGDYTVETGAYLFTLKNLINKPFSISRGSRISWSGDPYNAMVDMKALYKVTAPVKVFFPEETQEIYSRSYPVDLAMNLTGDLMQPKIDFDINMPSADRSIQDAIQRYTMTELERNRQVFSLLVLNQFMTPSEFRSPSGTESGSNNVATTTTTELLVNQLNVWLEQISKDFDFKVKYRQNDQINQDELELYLGKALLNDRLTVDGSFGVMTQSTTSTQNTNSIVGDVNVEYKITEDGRVRVRAFNKSNDNALLTAAGPFTQGIGVFYREDFDNLRQLIDRYKHELAEDKKERDERRKKREAEEAEKKKKKDNS